MRWWSEFWNPSLKCERLGHSTQVKCVEGFCLPRIGGKLTAGFGGIAWRVEKGYVPVCRRCGHFDYENVKVERSHPINSLSMETYKWERMNECGYFLREVK